MKGLIGLFLFFLSTPLFAQYYYKDIVLTKQATENWKKFKDNRVREVILESIEGNGQPTEGFDVRQVISSDFSKITTTSKATSISHSSTLTAFYDSKGYLQRTMDTSDTYKSESIYEYDSNGRIISITNLSTETDNQVKNSEKHIWNYDQGGKITSMLKIKQDLDTTKVKFVSDEKGNITEERPMRNKIAMPSTYYYYSNDNLLTDIVRYNQKAQRLLPDYIFEYSNGRLSAMLFVPEGSNDYQKWLYEYNEKGLKSKETCYNKRKEMLGRIEYQYNYK
ncbi:MAG: hypothetical protein C5B59_11020 [Bacteroidetes bacterium]|nr:MAG: hypothetical protein C5B59_11020 [Bacteroidota bacterium]